MAANVGAPVLAPRCDAGATPWQFVHHVSARCRPAAVSPISLSDAPGQDPATTRATRRTWFGAWCHRSWCLAPRLGCQHGETWLFCRHRSRSMGLSIAQGSANRQNKGTDHVRTRRSCPGWGPLPRIAKPRETSISLPISTAAALLDGLPDGQGLHEAINRHTDGQRADRSPGARFTVGRDDAF